MGQHQFSHPDLAPDTFLQRERRCQMVHGCKTERQPVARNSSQWESRSGSAKPGERAVSPRKVPVAR